MTATLSWVPRINVTKLISVVPTITASSAYTTGFQLGGIMTLTDVVRQDRQGLGGGVAELRSITILDGDAQSAAIDVWFFSQPPTLSSSNFQAFTITLANAKLSAIGAVSVGATYSSAASISQSTDGKNLGLILEVPSTVTNLTNIYAVAVVRGIPTYTTTTSLQFQFGFYVD